MRGEKRGEMRGEKRGEMRGEKRREVRGQCRFRIALLSIRLDVKTEMILCEIYILLRIW